MRSNALGDTVVWAVSGWSLADPLSLAPCCTHTARGLTTPGPASKPAGRHRRYEGENGTRPRSKGLVPEARRRGKGEGKAPPPREGKARPTLCHTAADGWRRGSGEGGEGEADPRARGRPRRCGRGRAAGRGGSSGMPAGLGGRRPGGGGQGGGAPQYGDNNKATAALFEPYLKVENNGISN